MKKMMLLALLALPSVAGAESSPQIPEAKAPASTPSLGVSVYHSPLSSSDGKIIDTSMMFDITFPATRWMTWTVAAGLRDETWKFGTTTIYSGPAYSASVRFHLPE